MKLFSMSLRNRFITAITLMIAISSAGYGILFHSIRKIENMYQNEATDHVSVLSTNSVISRSIFDLSSRVKLLEQALLYQESVITQEGFNIDGQLQQMRQLSSDPDFTEHMDHFIEDFHRFLGNSISLNRILRELSETDETLGNQLDELEAEVNWHQLQNSMADPDAFNDDTEVMMEVRESYLKMGKILGSIRSRITPDTEKVVIIEAFKELEILKLHLTHLYYSDGEIKTRQKEIQRTLKQFHSTLRKMQANLEQRWEVMNSLMESQTNLLSLVEHTEENIQTSALNLKNNLEDSIYELQALVILIALSASLISILIISTMTRRHIKQPLETLIGGLGYIEASNFDKRIDLQRSDEWKHLENAFNNMASNLKDSYQKINQEKTRFNHLAHHDPLTGMVNRLYIYQQLRQLIEMSHQSNAVFWVMYLDIDQFKNINDSLGHGVGDTLLKNVAARIKETLGECGVAARLGGDEFMVLLPGLSGEEQVFRLAEKLNHALRFPFELKDGKIFATSSIGLCRYPEDGRDMETLVRNADTAMYHAKRQGRDRYCVYQSSMTLEAHDLVQTSSGIRRALEHNEFTLYFQPQYDLTDYSIVGAEALIRWNHPELGLLLPGRFLPVAEQTGLITEIDDWVFREMVSMISRWQSEGAETGHLRFSVNFSGRRFQNRRLPATLRKILSDHNIDARQLTLEITEQDIMTNLEKCCATVAELRSHGFRVAIDDFGTGYSSLASLRSLPADFLKIDRTFVQDLAINPSDVIIIRSIMDIAEELGMDVIAEGVETQAQVEKLLEVECQWGQGYLLTRPVEEKVFLSLIENQPQNILQLSNKG